MPNQELIKIQQTYLSNSEYWLNHYCFFLKLNCSSPQPDPKEINYYLNCIKEELSYQSYLKKEIELLQAK